MEYIRLEQLLVAHGVTVYQVAKATGISPSTFSDWKSGRSAPKAEKLTRIADYFGIGMDELLGIKPSRSEGNRQRRTGVLVPVIDRIYEQEPIVTSKGLIGMELAEVPDPEDYFYLAVTDNEMQGCGIVRGTYVLFRKQQDAESGSIVASQIRGEAACVRRLERRSRRILLCTENGSDSPTVLVPEDFETGRARILGIAIEAKTKFLGDSNHVKSDSQ